MPPALPKLSYVLLSHNREKYIRQAIESAFAQDYEGELEYIFSDDCSTDRTYEIIKECVAAYKGNRRVVVTQTPRNLHLAGNTNHAVQYAESDWVIRADDDDISHISRCTLIGKAIAAHPGCRYVFTRMRNFSDTEAESIYSNSRQPITQPYLETVLKHGSDSDYSVGLFADKDCLHQAWHRSVYQAYGPIPEDGYYVDDVICHYRAMSLGCGVFLDAETAYIRAASNNMSRGGDNGQRGYAAIVKLERFHDKYYNIVIPPLKLVYQQLSESSACKDAPDILKNLAVFIARHEDYASFWRKGCINRFNITKKRGRIGVFALIRCLPMPVFAFLLATLRKLKDLIK